MAEMSKEDQNAIPENERWKLKPPYKVHNPDDGFKALYEGACHCGKVTYQLGREKPLSSKYCHCADCQIMHGALFQWAAIFHKEDINFTSGHDGLEWYDASTKRTQHKLPCKVRCNHCHSPIMDEGRNMILLFPPLLKLDAEGREKFKPECHMFYPRRRIDLPDGLPKWSGLNDQSDLIEDSPPEMVKELKRKREAEKSESPEGSEN